MTTRFTKLIMIIGVLLILFFLPSCAKGDNQPADSDERIKAVETGLIPATRIKGQEIPKMTIQERLKYYRVPGVSIAVIDQGRIAWARGYGVKEAGTNDPVTPKTLFQAASISKPVAALGVMTLVEKGTLTLDSPINAKLKSWKVPEHQWTGQTPITLRHLLTHTGGLTVHGFPGYKTTDALPTVIQILNGEKPSNTGPIKVASVPGKSWKYSGGGFTIAQLLIADVTGQPFEQFLKISVLDPCGMKNSTYKQPLPHHRVRDAASAHLSDGTVVKGKWHVYPEQAAAGLWTTPTDLCRFALELSQSAQGQSDQVISADVVRQILTSGIGDWGLGIGISDPDTPEVKSFSHGGGNKGFRCFLFTYVSKGQGAVIMTNGDRGGDLYPEILRSISEVYNWTTYKSREVEVMTLRSDQIQGFCGEFQLKNGPEIVVKASISDGQLHIFTDQAGDWALYPVSENIFIELSRGTYVGFIRDAEGRYDQLKISPNRELLDGWTFIRKKNRQTDK